MDLSKQFINCKKSQPIPKSSSFYLMIEGFSELEYNKELLSKKIRFLDSDNEWFVSIKKANSIVGNIELKFFLLTSDFIWKSNFWSFSVSGTVNENRLVTASYKTNIHQKQTSISEYIKVDIQKKPFLELSLTMTISQNQNYWNKNLLQQFIDTTRQYKNIISNNQCILNESKYSDFTFIVKGETFKVHKNILAAASSVFDKLFRTKLIESTSNKCCVTDIEPNIFQYLLNFIYCGKLPDQLQEQNVSRKLFEAAHYYEINELVDICTSVEHYKLSKDNAVDIYEWADTYDLKDIKMDAWKIVQFDILEMFDVKQPPSIHSIRSVIARKEEKKKFLEECRLKLSEMEAATKDLLE